MTASNGFRCPPAPPAAAGVSRVREAVRQSGNDLIRYGGIFDAVADFDAAVRDPGARDRIPPAFDSGDHPHFDDAGLQATADAVGLTSLTGLGSLTGGETPRPAPLGAAGAVGPAGQGIGQRQP